MKKLLALAALTILLFAGPLRPSTPVAQAAGLQLFFSQVCSTQQPGLVTLDFTWQDNDPSATQQWVDLSLFDNDWQPDTFLGFGPLTPATTSIVWDGLLANTPHYVRVNQQLESGSWDASATYFFTTRDCSSVAALATAKSQLAGLAVQAPAPMTGYSRAQFGPEWSDVDHNGCDTRNDILRRDLTSVTLQGTSNCIIQTGVLADPYTAKTIPFTRGVGTSSAVQIDHVVALGDAWRTGAAGWDAATRLQYANDPQVLLAVDGPANGSKGDSDAAEWLPPNDAFNCTYAELQVTIKARYSLWVTQAEHDALAGVLDDCDTSSPAESNSSSSTTPTAPDGHTWYTSSAGNATRYYCDLDDGWKSLNPANLLSYPSEAALLARWGSARTKATNSKC